MKALKKKTEVSKQQIESTLCTGVQLKSGPYFNLSSLFTKIYNMLYYTKQTN